MELIRGDDTSVTDEDDQPIEFTTAVIVRFHDDLLHTFCDALNAAQSDGSPSAETLATDLWNRLSYSETRAYSDLSGQVTPESLVHFEDIERLILRNTAETETADTESSPLKRTWIIDRYKHDLSDDAYSSAAAGIPSETDPSTISVRLEATIWSSPSA